MNDRSRFRNSFNVLLDDETAAKLRALTENGRLSRAHVIRSAIANAYAMSIEHRPTCSNGNACHCPHMHSFPPRPHAGAITPPLSQTGS